MIKNVSPAGSAKLDEVHQELLHRSYVFPDMSTDIDLTCTFTAGTSKGYLAWAEITDSDSNKLTTIVASYSIHISALRIRSVSVADKLYVIELGYGASASAVPVIDVHEFGSGTKKIDSDEQGRVRAPAIPKGQKVYYRMKCETNSATANVELRYHHH